MAARLDEVCRRIADVAQVCARIRLFRVDVFEFARRLNAADGCA